MYWWCWLCFCKANVFAWSIIPIQRFLHVDHYQISSLTAKMDDNLGLKMLQKTVPCFFICFFFWCFVEISVHFQLNRFTPQLKKQTLCQRQVFALVLLQWMGRLLLDTWLGPLFLCLQGSTREKHQARLSSASWNTVKFPTWWDLIGTKISIFKVEIINILDK